MGLKERTPTTVQEYLDYKTKFSNWGRWGDDDQFGTLNHINTDIVKETANLIKTGKSVSCANPLATQAVIPDSHRNPKPADHEMSVHERGSGDYIGVSYHGFVNTHIDALCHFFTKSVEEGGRLYNDKDPALVTESGATSHSIENWRDGIVTRGVLYDIPKFRGTDFVELDKPVEGWELEDWAKSQGITPQTGDAVFIRSGYKSFWKAHPDLKMTFPPNTPGNAPSIIEFLYNTDASLLGWDLQESGYRDHDYPARIAVHEVIIPHMGMPILDNADFDRLSNTCEELGRYTFHLTIAPLVVEGGTGSPVNPIALF